MARVRCAPCGRIAVWASWLKWEYCFFCRVGLHSMRCRIVGANGKMSLNVHRWVETEWWIDVRTIPIDKLKYAARKLASVDEMVFHAIVSQMLLRISKRDGSLNEWTLVAYECSSKN